MTSEPDTMRPPEFEPFFAHMRLGRLAFPLCQDCDRFHWYPMPRCPHCRSARITWRAVPGRGEIFSLTTVRHAFDKSRADDLPYVVALVTFAAAPGVQLITNIVGPDAASAAIGDAVEALYPAEATVAPRILFSLAKRGSPCPA